MSPAFCRYLLLCCILGSELVMSVTSSRVRRTNDVDQLQAVVEQLSQQITTLSSDVAALKAKTDATVAFHAWHSTNPLHTAAHSTLILDHAFINVGNAYSALTGIFTTPVSGLYHFQLSIMDRELGNGDYVHGSIVVDGHTVAIAISDHRHGYYSQAAATAVVHLQAGQNVYVMNPDSFDSNYYDEVNQPYTTFTGFLIRAD